MWLLEALPVDGWYAQSLCDEWSVDQVVAHLTAGATTGTARWIRSMLFAGFNPAKHNDRRLREQLGVTPADTFERFRRASEAQIAPSNAYAAMLGENIVHGQDIAQPLGLELRPDPAALLKVARFYIRKDFAVNSKSQVQNLRLEATDAEFEGGSGPLVRGPLLALVMVMAGRKTCIAGLDEDGVPELGKRFSS